MRTLIMVFFILFGGFQNSSFSNGLSGTDTQPERPSNSEENTRPFTCGASVLPHVSQYILNTHNNHKNIINAANKTPSNEAKKYCDENDFSDVPYLSDITPSSARIVASTLAPARMKLGVWQYHSFIYAMEIASFSIVHNFKINGLNPDTAYSVQLIGRTTKGKLVRSQMYFFRTPSPFIFDEHLIDGK